MNTSAVRSSIVRLAETRRHHGLAATLRWGASRLGEKLLRLEVAEILWLDASQLPRPIKADSAFTFSFLTPAEVARFAIDPIYELGLDCVGRAATGNHFCFAALNGDRLASYSWYSSGAIEGAHNLGVAMTLPANMAYMYKAFTHPDYRGRRLYGTGIALALEKLTERGITKLLTTIHTHNFASLASCRRLGFTRIGRIWSVRRGGHCLAIKPRKAAAKLEIQFICAE